MIGASRRRRHNKAVDLYKKKLGLWILAIADVASVSRPEDGLFLYSEIVPMLRIGGASLDLR
jgi:hypothetical protein